MLITTNASTVGMKKWKNNNIWCYYSHKHGSINFWKSPNKVSTLQKSQENYIEEMTPEQRGLNWFFATHFHFMLYLNWIIITISSLYTSKSFFKLKSYIEQQATLCVESLHSLLDHGPPWEEKKYSKRNSQ